MQRIIVLDGGMGRELSRRGAPFQQPEWSALALMQKPSCVQDVHEDFIKSGAQVIATNSYALVPFHIGEERFQSQGPDLIKLSGQLAKQAVQNTKNNVDYKVKIAASIPPVFGSYRADLFKAEQAHLIAQPLIDNLAPYADLWLFETQSTVLEPQTLFPLLPVDGKERWVSFTLFDEEKTDTPKLRSGETVEFAVTELLKLNVSAVLFNCSQPEVISQALEVTQKIIDQQGLDVRTGAYANAFQPQKEDAQANDEIDEIRADLGTSQYLEWAQKWQAIGASVIGGCCGIGPEYIKVLSTQLK